MNEPTINGEFIRITNREIYAEIRNNTTKIDNLGSTVESVVKLLEAHDTRLEKLENRFNGMVVGIGTGIIVGLVAIFRGVIG